jgi:hypothetical protein
MNFRLLHITCKHSYFFTINAFLDLNSSFFIIPSKNNAICIFILTFAFLI